MDIFLVRHGEAAANWGEAADPGLSVLGRQQAEDAAQRLRQLAPQGAALLSSPLRRALETAEPLALLLQKDVRESEAFREIPSPVPLAQRQQWLREFMRQQWSGQPAGLLAWRAAAMNALLELEQPAIVFTHFLVINAVVGHVLEKPQTLCFWPSPASITRLTRTGSRLDVIGLGQEMVTAFN